MAHLRYRDIWLAMMMETGNCSLARSARRSPPTGLHFQPDRYIKNGYLNDHSILRWVGQI